MTADPRDPALARLEKASSTEPLDEPRLYSLRAFGFLLAPAGYVAAAESPGSHSSARVATRVAITPPCPLPTSPGSYLVERASFLGANTRATGRVLGARTGDILARTRTRCRSIRAPRGTPEILRQCRLSDPAPRKRPAAIPRPVSSAPFPMTAQSPAGGVQYLSTISRGTIRCRCDEILRHLRSASRPATSINIRHWTRTTARPLPPAPICRGHAPLRARGTTRWLRRDDKRNFTNGAHRTEGIYHEAAIPVRRMPPTVKDMIPAKDGTR